MIIYTPRLRNAVAESTQPLNPVREAEARRNLQAYLMDQDTADGAYDAIIDRASSRPLSPVVVAKCVALLKDNLFRYPPREDTLASIQDFCVAASLQLEGRPDLQKSLSYVLMALPACRSAATSHPRLLQRSETGYTPAAQRLGWSPSVSSGGQHARSKSDIHTATGAASRSAGFRAGRVSAGGDAPFTSGAHPASPESPGGTSMRHSSAAAPCARGPDTLVLNVLRERYTRPEAEDEVLRGNPIGQQLKRMLNWTARIPALKHHLAQPDPPPSADPPTGAGTLRRSAASVLGSRAGRVLVDPAAQAGYIHAIAQDQQLQANKRTGLQRISLMQDRAGERDRARVRPLFQYRPYSDQEPLELPPAAVEAVLGVLFTATPVTPSDITPTASDRQACGTILMKLLMDMWMGEQPALLFLTTLHQLEKGLKAPQAAHRREVFDVLYNLSLHAQLLYEADIVEDWPADPGTAPEDLGADPAVSDMHSMMSGQSPLPSAGGVMTSHHRSPSAPPSHLGGPAGRYSIAEDGAEGSEGEGSGATSPARPPPAPQMDASPPLGGGEGRTRARTHASTKLQQLERWLGNLLCELMLELVHANERSEEVWTSALSCMLHLVAQAGAISRPLAAGVPQAVLARLLDVCLEFSWSSDLHTHLVCLAVNLMYTDASSSPGGEGDSGGRAGPRVSAAIPQWETAQLDPGQVQAFGGLAHVVTHFHAAASAQARSNLLCVILDVMSSETGVGKLPVWFLGSTLPPAAVVHLMQGGALTYEQYHRALLSAAECGDEGAIIMSDAFEAHLEGLADLIAHLQDLLIAVQAGYNSYGPDPPSWQSLHTALQATLGGVHEPDTSMVSPASWQALASLMASNRPKSAAYAKHWLHQLLMTAAIRGIANAPVPRALLPPPPNSAQSGLMQQEHLSQVLADILRTSAKPAHTSRLLMSTLERFLVSVRALLLPEDLGTGSEAGGGGTPTMACMHPSDLELYAATFEVALDWVLVPESLALRQEGLLRLTSVLMDAIALPITTRGEQHEDSSGGACALLLGQRGVSHKLLAALPVRLLHRLFTHIDARKCAPGPWAAGRGLQGCPGWGHLVSNAHSGEALDSPAFGMPWAGSKADARVAVLVCLLGKCTLEPDSVSDIGGEVQFTDMLYKDPDARVRFYVSVFLLQRLVLQRPQEYRKALRDLVLRAQKENNELVLDNPYMQMASMYKTSL